jgi:hypothetical protein
MSHPEVATNGMISEPSAKAERVVPNEVLARAGRRAWCAVHLRAGRTGGSSLFPLVAQTVMNTSAQTSAAVPDAEIAVYQEQLLNAAIWVAALPIAASKFRQLAAAREASESPRRAGWPITLGMSLRAQDA